MRLSGWRGTDWNNEVWARELWQRKLPRGKSYNTKVSIGNMSKYRISVISSSTCHWNVLPIFLSAHPYQLSPFAYLSTLFVHLVWLVFDYSDRMPSNWGTSPDRYFRAEGGRCARHGNTFMHVQHGKTQAQLCQVVQGWEWILSVSFHLLCAFSSFNTLSMDFM